MNWKRVLPAVLWVLALTACADDPAVNDAPVPESVPVSAALCVSDLDTVFAGLDLSAAILTRYDKEKDSYSAAAAIRAEHYIGELRSYIWEEYQAPAGWEENTDYCCQLTAPGVTLTAPQRSYNDSRLLHVVTESGEGWFTLPYIEEDQVDWMIYDAFARWYEEAQAAALYGGRGTPLTAEELDWFQDYTTTEWSSYDEILGGSHGGSTAISCFFTSKYSDPRDMDAREFLAYCPDQGILGAEDEEEFRWVWAKMDWGNGEDDNGSSVTELPVPCHRYPRTYIDEILTQYAGITVEDMHTDWKEEAIYVPETDCFYNFTSDFGPGRFELRYGEKDGDIVTLWEALDVYDNNTADTLILQRAGDGYHILSHQPAATS